MEVLYIIIWSFVVVLSVIISMISKKWRESLSSGLVGGIVGAIIGLLLSVFSIMSFGFSGLAASVVLSGIGFFIIGLSVYSLTAIWYVLPPFLKKPITYLLVFGFIFLMIYLAIFFWQLPVTSEYLKLIDIEPVQKGFGEIAKFRYCFYADPRCPFFVQWENPNVQTAEEELYVDVDFSEKKISPENTINLLVSFSVSNPEFGELKIKPKCYLGKDKEKELEIEKMGAYAYGDEFIFPTTASGQELHTTLRCKGEIQEAIDKNIYSEMVVIELERPVIVKTVWPVWIGLEPKIGLVKSEMKFNAPYSIAMTSHNDMPFEEGKEYDFQIVLKRQAEESNIKEVKYIVVSFPEGVLASCEHFQPLDHEIELLGQDYETLKNIANYNLEYEKFTFPCSLYVSKAPRQAVLSPIELEAEYIVYSDYKTKIIKSP